MGAGRDGNKEKLSARCQFYIVHNKKGLHRLDGDYTVFGKVIKGLDVLDAVINVEKYSTDTPLITLSLKVSVISVNETELKELYPEVKLSK